MNPSEGESFFRTNQSAVSNASGMSLLTRYKIRKTEKMGKEFFEFNDSEKDIEKRKQNYEYSASLLKRKAAMHWLESRAKTS